MVIKTLPKSAHEAWTLGREIGHGAYGAVHLATGPKGQVAAVKVCRREAMDRDRYERELRGARLYKSIQTDEGLVRMLGVFEHDWGFSAVMELADDEFGENPAPRREAWERHLCEGTSGPRRSRTARGRGAGIGEL